MLNLAMVILLALAATRCAEAPTPDEETGLAVDPCVTTTPVATPYVYVEPNIILQQNVDLAHGTTGGHVILAADSNIAVYLIDEENQSAYPNSQIVYRSSDGGVTWQQRGAIPFLSNQCASALVALPKSYNNATQHRLIYVEMACDYGPYPGNGNSTCAVITLTSDDGGSTWAQTGNATGPFNTDYCTSALGVDDIGAVHLVYTANGASTPNAVLHNVSSDGGQSWGANTKIGTVAVTPRWPSISATGPAGKHQMNVAYEMTEPDANGRWAVGGFFSNDNGATWSTPTEILPPIGNDMLSAPCLAALDANTSVVSYYHTLGDRNSDTGRQVGLSFGAVQSKAIPTYGARKILGSIGTFPPSIVALSPNTLLVAVGQSSSGGPYLMRLGLKR